MYELRRGTMMMLTPNKSDVEMYKKAGWILINKSSKKKKEKVIKNVEDNKDSNIIESEPSTID